MPSPQLNLRIAPEHHDLLRAVAARLRLDAAFAGHLGALLAGVAAPVAAPVADASTLASILARLDALERGTVAQAEAVPPPVPSDSLPPGNWSEAEAAALRSIRLGR
jgi:hypothetical protein